MPSEKNGKGAPVLGRGPRWLQKWSSQIAAAINANKPTAGIGISIHESAAGTAISTSKESNKENEAGGGDDGGGGGGGATETITGAVNGVPSTLNVITDGPGWIAI